MSDPIEPINRIDPNGIYTLEQVGEMFGCKWQAIASNLKLDRTRRNYDSTITGQCLLEADLQAFKERYTDEKTQLAEKKPLALRQRNKRRD